MDEMKPAASEPTAALVRITTAHGDACSGDRLLLRRGYGDRRNHFYAVASGVTPIFFIIWELSNFAGPITLGRLFDTVGRKPMIAGSYLGSAVIAVVLAGVFLTQAGGVWMFTAVLVACFFLASAGAIAAYLTVSEIFPSDGNRWHRRTRYGTAEKQESEPNETEADGARRGRIAARAQRRQVGESGLRRYRTGPRLGGYSPWMQTPPVDEPETALDREIEILYGAVHEYGQVNIDTLYSMVGARYWGPGEFRRAMREAIAEGRLERIGRRKVGVAHGDG